MKRSLLLVGLLTLAPAAQAHAIIYDSTRLLPFDQLRGAIEIPRREQRPVRESRDRTSCRDLNGGQPGEIVRAILDGGTGSACS